VRLIDILKNIFSNNYFLYSLIISLIILPIGLFVIPTLNLTMAAGIVNNDDPMNNISSTREVKVDNEKEEETQINNQTNTSYVANQEVEDIEQPVNRSVNYLLIPGKVSSPVVGVGLDASGAIAVPDSAVGMYSQRGQFFRRALNRSIFKFK